MGWAHETSPWKMKWNGYQECYLTLKNSDMYISQCLIFVESIYLKYLRKNHILLAPLLQIISSREFGG